MDAVFNIENIDAMARQVLDYIGKPAVVGLYGQMGAGKTTLVSALCRQLQVTEAASSPTFSIINEYEDLAGNPVYHLDLYRIQSEAEAQRAGVEECFYTNNWCFVEWPERIEGLLPAERFNIYLKQTDSLERSIQVVQVQENAGLK